MARIIVRDRSGSLLEREVSFDDLADRGQHESLTRAVLSTFEEGLGRSPYLVMAMQAGEPAEGAGTVWLRAYLPGYGYATGRAVSDAIEGLDLALTFEHEGLRP